MPLGLSRRIRQPTSHERSGSEYDCGRLCTERPRSEDRRKRWACSVGEGRFGALNSHQVRRNPPRTRLGARATVGPPIVVGTLSLTLPYCLMTLQEWSDATSSTVASQVRTAEESARAAALERFKCEVAEERGAARGSVLAA